jgi:hypothetical protein
MKNQIRDRKRVVVSPLQRQMNTKDTTTLFLTDSVNRAPLWRSRLMLRSLTAVFLVAVGAVIFAFSALADRPTRTTFEGLTGSSVLTDVCAFPVNVDWTVSGTETDYYDQSGTLTRSFFHQVEQDTFTANGRTLVGIPFQFNFYALFDSDGNVTQAFTDGVVETIPLPDGTLFISAGRADWTQRLGGFILSPDMGNSGNLAAFCAALSP